MKTADKKIAVEIMMKHCTDNGLISMCKGNSILKAMEEYASQKQVSRGKIIKATEEAYDKWSRLENENTTYLGELIAIELSELTKGKGETHNPEGYYPKHPSEKNLGELPTEQPQSEQKRKKRKLNPDRDFTMND